MSTESEATHSEAKNTPMPYILWGTSPARVSLPSRSSLVYRDAPGRGPWPPSTASPTSGLSPRASMGTLCADLSARGTPVEGLRSRPCYARGPLSSTSRTEYPLPGMATSWTRAKPRTCRDRGGHRGYFSDKSVCARC
ncbi:hypothetical protein C8Q77DRAFT_437844 [Trametes polyzona]|nr:hypothetical protein C8Q77DRAFT_437844 [Trametes polyzona]